MEPGTRPFSTTVDWYSLTVPTVNWRAVALAGEPDNGTRDGRAEGTGVLWRVQLPSGPHSTAPVTDEVVAQFTSTEVWVRSVR